MSRNVEITEEVIVVSKGKEDIGKLVSLGNDGKFDPSLIPPSTNAGSVGEVDGDNTLHITHEDGTTTIGEAKGKYDVLWSGSAGTNGSTLVQSVLPLNKSLSNYSKIGVSLVCYNAGGSIRPQYREFTVDQLQYVISTGVNASLSCTWGYSASTDSADISSASTLTSLVVNSVYTIVKEIRGIY